LEELLEHYWDVKFRNDGFSGEEYLFCESTSRGKIPKSVWKDSSFLIKWVLLCRWDILAGSGSVDIPFEPQRKMSESPQKTGLSGKQWFFLLIAFLLGVASVFTLAKIMPVQGPASPAVQAATNNR